MKYFGFSRRASKRPATSRHRQMGVESLEPRQLLACTAGIDFPISDMNVIISEIMYFPPKPSDDELDEGEDIDGIEKAKVFEYIELYNRGSEEVDLTEWKFVGVFGRNTVYKFRGAAAKRIQPGQHLLLVRNLDAFEIRYENVSFNLILGEFPEDTGLSNSGEFIELQNDEGCSIALIDYKNSDPWPEAADGAGSSLQIKDTLQEGTDLYRPRNWIASRELKGSPGSAGLNTDLGLVINEVLAASNDAIGELDKIELYNTTETAIHVKTAFPGGLFLTDKNDFTEKYRIPDSTVIPAEGYFVVDENAFRFENPLIPFGLSSVSGERLSLLALTSGDGKLIVDTVSFGATRQSESIGRLPDGRGALFPLNDQSFGVANTEPVESEIVISEIHYNPVEIVEQIDGTFRLIENLNLEFIEIVNISGSTLVLNPVGASNQWRLRKDVDFDFPTNTTLRAGRRLLVLRFDPRDGDNADLKADFEAFYDISLNVGGGVKAYGGYAGVTRDEMDDGKGKRLSNSGGEIELQKELGDTNQFFPRDLVIYRDRDAWPNRPDGGGSSLQRKALDLYGNDPDSWRPSIAWNGSPGSADDTTVDVIINEVLTHTDDPLIDTIELYNTSDVAIDVGNWLLSDSGNNYFKHRLVPDDPLLQPGEYMLLDENDFNLTRNLLEEDDPNRKPGEPFRDPNDFGLSSAHGETLWLLETDAAGNPVRFANRVRIGASANGESFGRIPNGDPEADLVPNEEVSLGAPNSGDPRVGPLVISEIMYNPLALPADSPFDGNDLEFIEVFNPTSLDVDLTEWRLDGGVKFRFRDVVRDPDGSRILQAGEALVILSFNPEKPESAAQLAKFREVYNIGEEVQLVGGYGGSLANGGERLELQRSDEPPSDEPEFYPRLLEDEVIYDDVAPWPTSPDGGGDSLHRTGADLWGRAVTSWNAAAPTPGTTDLPPASPAPLMLEALSQTELQLSWTDASWEDSYHVFQWIVDPGSWLEVQTLAANTTSVVLGGREPGVTYTYKVEAHTTFYAGALNQQSLTSSGSQEITMPGEPSLLVGDLTLDGAVDANDLFVLLSNWNTLGGAALGDLFADPDPAKAGINADDLFVLLGAWTGPLDVGAGAPQAVIGSSIGGSQDQATTAVFEQIGEEASSDNRLLMSRTARRRAGRHAASRFDGAPLRRLQAAHVDRAMTDREGSSATDRGVLRRTPSRRGRR